MYDAEHSQITGQRKSIAYVPQETIIHNRIFPDIPLRAGLAQSNAKITHASQQSALTEMLRKLPLILELRVGEPGIKLPGRKWQRVTLARALLSKPQLRTPDDAINALDADKHPQKINTGCSLNGIMIGVFMRHQKEGLAGLIENSTYLPPNEVGTWRPFKE